MKEMSPQELINKYLAGKCTDEEKHKVETWYHSFDNDPDPVATFSQKQKDAVKSLMFSEINRNIRKSNSAFHTLPTVWIRYAAAVAAMAVIAAGLNWNSLIKSSLNAEALKTKRNVTIKNSGKSMSRALLPDSSTVWLQPGASLKYPERLDGRLREITMQGSAFFEVTHDSLRPFIVYSGEITTRVLGTSFSIRASTSGATLVSVLTGKVSVKRIPQTLAPDQKTSAPELQKGVVLLAAESVLVLKDNKALQKKQTGDISEMEMWKKNTISFNNVTVDEVVASLNETFNTKIEVASEDINQYVLKADFSGMNLPEILEILERSLHLTYEINAREIVLKKRL